MESFPPRIDPFFYSIPFIYFLKFDPVESDSSLFSRAIEPSSSRWIPLDVRSDPPRDRSFGFLLASFDAFFSWFVLYARSGYKSMGNEMQRASIPDGTEAHVFHYPSGRTMQRMNAHPRLLLVEGGGSMSKRTFRFDLQDGGPYYQIVSVYAENVRIPMCPIYRTIAPLLSYIWDNLSYWNVFLPSTQFRLEK